MNLTMPGSGELAALAAAGLWACSSLFYSRVRLTAWQINFGKNVLASGILLLHLGLQALVLRTSLLSVDQRAVVWLVLSSLTGIVIGDTLYFRSLQILGPRRALIVSTTSPLFAASAGWLLLSEPLSVMALSGLIVTLTGVFLVVTDRPVSGETAGHFPASVLRGVLAGLGGGPLQRIRSDVQSPGHSYVRILQIRADNGSDMLTAGGDIYSSRFCCGSCGRGADSDRASESHRAPGV